MRILPHILMLCCGLFAACSTGSKEPKFPREETLTQELMPLQGITSPLWLEIDSPFLIVQNMQRSDSIFHIYDLSNYELKSVFGQTGRGPGELGFVQVYHTPFSDVYVGDINTNVITKFKINEEGQSTFIGTIEAKYKETHSIANAAFINDSLYVLADALYMPEGNLDLLSLQNEDIIKTIPYRNPKEKFNTAYVSANEDRIVLYYSPKKQIDFMDTDFNLIKRVEFEYDHPSDITNENWRDVKHSYYFCYLGKRYLYALFLGRSFNEHQAQSFRGGSLEVFDLNGNPVARYYLDGIAPDNFVVNEDTFTLYGVAYDNANIVDSLLIYKLKGLS